MSLSKKYEYFLIFIVFGLTDGDISLQASMSVLAIHAWRVHPVLMYSMDLSARVGQDLLESIVVKVFTTIHY